MKSIKIKTNYLNSRFQVKFNETFFLNESWVWTSKGNKRVATAQKWRGCSWTLTFDIAETGPGHPFTEVDERPLRLTSRQDVVVVSHSDDSMGSHGRYLKKMLAHRQLFN